jgi:hypothetical protein
MPVPHAFLPRTLFTSLSVVPSPPPLPLTTSVGDGLRIALVCRERGPGVGLCQQRSGPGPVG